MSIRQMRVEDADAVRQLDVQAFAPYYERLKGPHTAALRTRENVLACLALGFRVWHLGLRLLCTGECGRSPGVDLSRWAM